MWSRIGLKPKLLAQTKSLYFNKILSRNTSSYLLGWSPVTIDGLDALDNLLATPNEAAKMGRFNLGGYSSAKVDELANLARGELNAQKRTRLLQDALDLAHKEVGSIPLHFQVVIWASAPNVTLSQRADNYFQWYFVNRK
jgi:peptide/nickel transport system substrate-binding protein